MIRSSTLTILAAVAALAELPGGAGLARAARLPDGAQPQRYRIVLAPDLDAGTFSGEETIDITVAGPADAVVLHAVDLEILEARAGAPGHLEVASVAVDAASQTLRVAPPRALAAGPAQLSFRFRGKLDEKLRGLYLARSEGQRFALTQFEGTDARRAFPCFDEPARKARFQLTAVVARGLAAISNTAVTRRTTSPDGRTERVEFGESLPMSSYLVALAVGPFAPLTAMAGKTPITVWAAAGREHLGAYALREATAVLPRLEDWFGIAYPYGKLDLIAAPEFQFGGMENVAAITFRPSALLIDEAAASPQARRRVTEVIAHEIAHQWFGDLVTMAWWDDVWLNESFATWMEKKVIADLHPDWHIWRDFAVERGGPMAIDELNHAHPIRSSMLSEAEEPESSPAIIYGKGCAVLRMIETWLGEDRFRAGVRRYLDAHRFGNTTAGDFFASLQGASGQPVGEAAERWIAQTGHPLVSLEASCVGGRETRVLLRQERFQGDGGPAAASFWPTPVCLRYPGGADGKTTSRCVLLSEKEQSFALAGAASGQGCLDWIIGNADAAGFYRVRYDDASFGRLLKVAARVMSPGERVALLDDQWALVAAGRASMRAWLDTVAALRGERDMAVLDQLAHALRQIDRALGDAAGDRRGLRALAQSVFGPVLGELGTAARSTDDEDARRVRALAIGSLGGIGRVPALMDKARAVVQDWRQDPASFDGTLADAWVDVAARQGDAALFDRYLDLVRSDRSPEERDRFVDGLARFERPELLARALDLSLGGLLRTDEIDRPLRVALSQRAGQAAALSFLDRHLVDLEHRAAPYAMLRIAHATSELCGDAQARQVAELFARHPPERSTLAVALAVDQIRVCGALRRHGEAQLRSALLSWAAPPPR